MGAVDFSEWVAPDLVLTLGEHTYTVKPPSVDRARMILAAAVRAEVNLGLAEGPVPDEVTEVLATIEEKHPALTDEVYEQMSEDGVAVTVIDRMAYYAVFFWARGRAYADTVAALLWTPRESVEGGAPAPKAPPSSPPPSGHSTA